MPVSDHPPDRGVSQKFNIAGLLDPAYQIAGHVFVQVIAANHEQNPASMSCEKNRRLSRRVAAPDNDHRASAAKQRLGRCRGVINSRPFESLEALYIQSPILRTRRDEKALRRNGLTVTRIENRVSIFE